MGKPSPVLRWIKSSRVSNGPAFLSWSFSKMHESAEAVEKPQIRSFFDFPSLVTS